MFEELAQKIIDEYRSDPRNKVFVPEEVMLASVQEEAEKSIEPEALREIIQAQQNGTSTDEQIELFDAATYSCSYIAHACFAENPDDEDEEVDYQISFIERDSGEFVAEVRPS